MRTIPVDLAKALLDRAEAWEAFRELPPMLQDARVAWVESAVSFDDRAIRVQVVVDVLVRNRCDRMPLTSTAI